MGNILRLETKSSPEALLEYNGKVAALLGKKLVASDVVTLLKDVAERDWDEQHKKHIQQVSLSSHTLTELLCHALNSTSRHGFFHSSAGSPPKLRS